MERPLQKNSQITLYSDGKPTVFTITKIIGDGGASCVAYEVTYEETYKDDEFVIHNGILKEYFPRFLYDISSGFQRTEANDIVVSPDMRNEFEKGLAGFKKAYRTITELLAESPSAENYHPTQIGLFRGNNTYYTLTSRDDGISYDKYKEDDLLTTLKLMLTVTKAVEHYHSAGYLHLDIKPKNILILSNVTELIKLFDYDSLTSRADLASGNISTIPSPGYYVPELADLDIENIGISTDIFEIGATIYDRIYGHMPEYTEMEHDATFDFNISEMTRNVSPKIKYELNKLLKKTLSTHILPSEITEDEELYNSIYKDNLSYRYISTDELKKQLKKLIALVEHSEPYLLDLRNDLDISFSDYSFHADRRDIAKELHKKLSSKGYACLRGGEGYGKTDAICQYVKLYSKEYHTIQYYDYFGSLKAIVASMETSKNEANTFVSFDELLNIKNSILHTSDERTLIIIDNYDKPDGYINSFLPKNSNSFKVIFTSSNDSSIEPELSLSLQHLPREICESILLDEERLDEEDETTVHHIIKKCAHNPLALSLIANAIYRSEIDVKKCAELISEQQSRFDEELMELSYSTPAYMQLICNIKTAFRISQLSDAEKETLKALTLIPQCGILCSDFIRYCDSSSINENVIDYLFNQGIVSLRENCTKISLHPAICDFVMISNDFPTRESYHNLAAALDYALNPDTKNSFVETIRHLPHMQCLERFYEKNCTEESSAFLKAQLAQYYLKIEHIPNAYKIAKKLDMLIDRAKAQNKNVFDDYLCYYNCLIGLIRWKNRDHAEALSRFEIAQNVSHDIVEMFNKQFGDITLCSMLLSALCECELAPIGAVEIKSNDYIAAFDIALGYAQAYFKSEYIYYIAKKMFELSDSADQNAYPKKRYENIMLYNTDSPIKDMSSYELIGIIKAYTLLISSLRKAKDSLYLEANRCYDHAMIIANKLYGGFMTRNMIFNHLYYMACHFLKAGNYTLASDNLQKMLEMDVSTSGRLIRDTYVELKNNDSHRSMQGLIVLKYMALAYEYKNNLARSLDVYSTFFSIYDENTMDPDGSLRLDAVCCCIKHLIAKGETEKAIELTNREADRFAIRFGNNSQKKTELLDRAKRLFDINCHP